MAPIPSLEDRVLNIEDFLGIQYTASLNDELSGNTTPTPTELQAVIDSFAGYPLDIDMDLVTTKPIYLRDNSKIIITGSVTNIATNYNDASCFYAGNFHPNYFETMYDWSDEVNLDNNTLYWAFTPENFIRTVGQSSFRYPLRAQLFLPTDIVNFMDSSTRIVKANSNLIQWQGNDLYAPQNVSIQGGSLYSNLGAPIDRGGFYNCTFILDTIDCRDGLYVNGMTNSYYEIKDGITRGRLMEVKGYSSGSTAKFYNGTFGGSTENEPLISIGESSNGVDFEVVNVNAASFDQKQLVAINSGASNINGLITGVAPNVDSDVFHIYQAPTSPDQLQIDNVVLDVDVICGSQGTRKARIGHPTVDATGTSAIQGTVGGTFSNSNLVYNVGPKSQTNSATV